jgi:hypothetical protein
MKAILLILTVVMPDLKGHILVMTPVQEDRTLDDCQKLDAAKAENHYSNYIPAALDVHARCVEVYREKTGEDL